MNPERWRLRTRLWLSALAGAVLLLAHPPLDSRFVAWVALVPLLLALRGATARAGALCGLAAGLTFFGGVLYWIAAFGIVAWAPLVLAQALTWALFGWFGAWASHRLSGRLFGVPILFAAVELIRVRFPLGGFAWGLLGTTQHSGLPLLPLARVGGVFLVGIAVLLINAALAEVLANGRIWKRAAAAVVATGLAVGASYMPLGIAGPAEGRVRIAAVQINVRTYGVQRGLRSGPEDQRIIDALVETTASLSENPPDLVIWPENALDQDPFTNADVGRAVAESVRDVGAPFLVGAILDVDEKRFRNAILHYDAEGSVVGRYDKQHLVPFGEYVPWPSLREYIPALDQVPNDGIPGTAPVLFEAGGALVGGVICFESTFPELVREFVDKGAQVLVVATNNASFGRSTAAEEHLAQSKMRAVEHGRAVVHAAISGISAVVEPDGTVRRRTTLFERDIVRADVPLTSARTPYSRFGDAIEQAMGGAAGLVALAGFAGLLDRRRRRREDQAMQEFDWGTKAEPAADEPAPAAGDPAPAPAGEEAE